MLLILPREVRHQRVLKYDICDITNHSGDITSTY